jgi:hypothetical protein
MAIISKARADATSVVVSIGTSDGRVIHGDYDPDAQTFYCQHHGDFRRIGHFGGGAPDFWAHTPTRHLELFLSALTRPSTKPRRFDPAHNIFAQLVFNGREPSRGIARVLLPLLWGNIPIDVRRLSEGDEQRAAYQLDQFRRALGDA